MGKRIKLIGLLVLCLASIPVTQAKTNVKLTPISNYIWTLAEDGPCLWVGTASGISRLQKDSGEWTHYEGKNVKTILPDGDKLWVGTLNGFFSFQKNNETWKEYPDFKNMTVYAIAKTSSYIWVGTIEKGVGKLNPISGEVSFLCEKDGLPSNRIYALCADGNNLWIGTANGLVRYNSENNEFQVFQEKDGLAQNCVASLMLDGNTLWVGTLIGVSKLDKDTGKWESWSSYEPFEKRKNGDAVSAGLELADASIFSLAKDERYVYLGTNSGLYAYRKSSGTWMIPIKFNRLIKSICMSDNELYFAWSASPWEAGRLEKKSLQPEKYTQCSPVLAPPVAVKKEGNTYSYDAKMFQCHNYVKSYRSISSVTFIYRDEEMSLDFPLEENGKDILLTFHGVNGDHIVKPAPTLKIQLNDQAVATIRSTFLPENLAGIDGWSDMKVPVPARFLKKNNRLKIKNLGPDWWMINGIKITVMDTKIGEVCFDNLYANAPEEKKESTLSPKKTAKPFLVDGKPFFPVAMCSPFPEVLEDMHKVGFNCAILLNPRSGPLKETKRSYLDSALKHSMKVFATCGHPIQTAPKGERLDFAVFEKVIRDIGGHPALAAWYSNDEPETGLNYNKHYDEVNSPAAMRKLYDLIHSLDARNLPVLLNLCVAASYPQIARQYAEACDVLSQDHYSLTMTQTIRWADYLTEATSSSGNPAMIWLQAYYNPNSIRPRSPTPLEMKCMSYLSITRNMKGLMYFVYLDPKLTEIMFGDLPEELSQLQGIIAGDDAKENAKVEGDGIYVLLKDGSDGQYLIAVNSSTSEQKATFKLPGAFSGKVSVLFENRTLPVAAGALNDVFKPYERHVYKIQNN